MRALVPRPRSSSDAATVLGSPGPCSASTVSMAPVVVITWVAATTTVKRNVLTSPAAAIVASVVPVPTVSSTSPGY